ncbi:hypothetical protein B0H19DRAFT_1069718 [Mycena capillaripes]|nr:hypothetical protein B0H19DRAFT_1069718 [Mycena capillaripes]
MARTRRPLRGNSPLEVGDVNPLDDSEVRDPDDVVMKVTLTTSSPTLSLSNPDPFFRLLFDLEIFHSPRPNSALTVSTGRSALDASAYSLGAIRLYSMAAGQPYLLTPGGFPHYARQDEQNKDLLRDPDFDWLKFITVPASGSIRVEIPFPLEKILRSTNGVNEEDLKPGMKYRVWMRSTFLGHLGLYNYWGDLARDLKDKKLSSYSPFEPDSSPAEDSADYAAEVVAGDGWALRRFEGIGIRGNVGRFGPLMTKVSCGFNSVSALRLQTFQQTAAFWQLRSAYSPLGGNGKYAPTPDTWSAHHPTPFHYGPNSKLFHSPRPNSALTVSTGRSTLNNVFAWPLGGFRLVCITDGPECLLTDVFSPRYVMQDERNKDLLRNPDFDWLKFITVPASGSIRVELPLPLEKILLNTNRVDDDDLKPGMKYRVWMSDDLLGQLGDYNYWGDLAGDLKDKKLSSYYPEPDGFPAENASDYAEDVVAADGWVLQRSKGLDIRGNVGRFGPVIEFIE